MISVIIAAYNVENYIERCVRSVLGQENQDFEIILVDDGSVDKTAEICDTFAKHDSRIRVFHQKNSGVSSARNVGLENFGGEWVFMMDSDDFISADFLTIEPQFYTCDIICKDYKTISESNLRERCYINNRKHILCKKRLIEKHFVNHRCNALWNKIIRKEIVKDKRFNEEYSIGEDMLFYLSLIPDIKSIGFSHTGIYCQYLRDTSIMHRAFKNINVEISVAFYTLNELMNLNKKEFSIEFRESLIHTSCTPFLIKNAKYLNKDQRSFLNHLLSDIQYKSLIYVSFIDKLKLFLKSIFIGLKHKI